MKDKNFSSLTLTAIEAALKAGKLLQRGFGTTYEIMNKPGKQNLVTEYDKASEACIISIIREFFPTHNILAEESGYLPQSDNDILWIIDPLDGTINFAHHIPFFAISIAAYNKSGGLCGVIFQPLTHELFVAEKNQGAYLNEKPLSVSQTDRLETSLIITSLPYHTLSTSTHTPTLNTEHLSRLNQRGAIVRNFGSAALTLAYIAAGKIDAAFMHHLYPWDSAAGKLLIEESGGLVTSYPNSFSPHGPCRVLAANKKLHSILKSYLFHPD